MELMTQTAQQQLRKAKAEADKAEVYLKTSELIYKAVVQRLGDFTFLKPAVGQG